MIDFNGVVAAQNGLAVEARPGFRGSGVAAGDGGGGDLGGVVITEFKRKRE